jgi:hypothetical protein
MAEDRNNDTPGDNTAEDDATKVTRYLDLDGDGVPDAVETVSVGVTGGGSEPTTVELVDEVDAEIDDDGVPHTIAVERIVVTDD